MNKIVVSGEKGNSMLGLLAVMTISLAVVSGLLGNAASTSKVKAITDDRSDQFYAVENAIGKVNAWLQDNSPNFIKAFEAGQFSTKFDLGAPSIGANEVSEFSVPTQLKVKGTSNSVLLTNDGTFGTSAFPTTTPVGGGSFNAQTSFASAFSKENGNMNVNVRALLVWAAEASGNYAPIFRIDAITGNNPDKGVHAFAFSEATLTTTNTAALPGLVGYYGKDQVSISGNGAVCSAKRYIKSGSSWIQQNSSNGCVVASDGTTGNVALSGNATIQGMVQTLKVNGITTTGNANIGGKKANTCASSNPATCCKGPGCHAYAMPTYNTYANYCLSRCTTYTNHSLSSNGSTTLDSNGCYNNLSVSGNHTLYLTGNNGGPVSTGYCINTLTVTGNAKVYLEDYTNAYYIGSMSLSGNDSIKLTFPSDKEETEDVEMYVGTFGISGNATINATRKPLNLKIHALNTSGTLSISGNAEGRAILTAPGLHLNFSGNSKWHGSIRAKRLTSSGNALWYYDEQFMESPGSSVVSGATFSLRKTSIRSRDAGYAAVAPAECNPTDELYCTGDGYGTWDEDTCECTNCSAPQWLVDACTGEGGTWNTCYCIY